LANKREVFVSEADFQFALAWEIQRLRKDADIRLEYCILKSEKAPEMHLDILITEGNYNYPNELEAVW
jgi:hypothetical protein